MEKMDIMELAALLGKTLKEDERLVKLEGTSEKITPGTLALQ